MDFINYRYSPKYIKADKKYIDQSIRWVSVQNNTLYVSHSHSTYASSSKMMNAYITAIDLKSSEILWRSQPLVSNTTNFIIIDDSIVTGYGFTAEPDYLFVLDKWNGKIISKHKVKTGPNSLIKKHNKLFVSTYDTDYIYEIGRSLKLPLIITANPIDSAIRILNIVPKYKQGMLLESGKYHIEVSRNGYQTKKFWSELNEDNYNISVDLLPIANQQSQVAFRVDESSYEKDTTPPKIRLNRGIKVINKARKTIRGQAIDKSGVAIVEVNGKEAQLDEKGNFTAIILLKPGRNQIIITAVDIHENQATKTFTIERSSGTVESRPVAETIRTGKYFALLVGVEDYQSPTISDLNQPIKDAYQIRNILENYTFDSDNIILLENPSRDKIIDTFDQLSQKITKHDNLLIFYAGHGYWDKKFKQGYWLPSNASKNSRSKWLSNSTIRDYIRGIQTKHTLLVSDACFSGGIFKTRKAFDDATPATNELYKLPSRKAMTSGTLTEVPDRSVFIEYFVKRLRANENKYLSSEQLFMQFKDAVINNSPLRQVPQFGEIREAGDEGGDFIFVRREN